jgi:ketosteroid isomerase-like protein
MFLIHIKILATILFIVLLTAVAGCPDEDNNAALDRFREVVQAEERNRETAVKVIAAADSGDYERIRFLLSENFILSSPALTDPADSGDLIHAIREFTSVFPDWVHVIEDVAVDGDQVILRVRQQGTHQAEYMGIAPTGREVTKPGVYWMTIADGRVTEWWVLEDHLGFMRQLGMELKAVGADKQP